MVAIYGNYMLIIVGVTLLLNALFNSVNAGVGNLVAEGDKKTYKVCFWGINIIAYMVCFSGLLHYL